MIRRQFYVLFMSIMMLTGLCVTPAYSQYTIKWSVLDGGGGIRKTGKYTLAQSIGQPSVIGTSSGGQYTISAGFYGVNMLAGSVTAAKAQDTDRVQPGATIHYSISATNWFDSAIYFMIQDALDAYVDYVAGTLYVNEVQESDDWFSDDLLGYQSVLVDSGETLTIAFDVTVNDLVSPNRIIENVALVTAYRDLNDLSSDLVTVKTNTVETEVVPEASTFLSLGTGLLAVFVLMRRRRHKRR